MNDFLPKGYEVPKSPSGYACTRKRYADGFKRQKVNDIQRQAVADYLKAYNVLERDFAYNVGLEACGRIKSLGGRIHELRKEGWQIRTEDRDGACFYVLISMPDAKQLSLV